MWKALLAQLPRGYTLDEEDWRRRHRILLWVLAVHVPGLALFGVVLGRPAATVLLVPLVPAACLVLGHLLARHRRTAAVLVTAGLVYSSGALVGLTDGTIEAHFHFFIIIGFIALYQDWAPFLFNVAFTVLSHGVGSIWQQSLIFNHAAAQQNPWMWSLVHGIAVLLACVGMMLFWRITEEQQQQKNALAQQLTEAEIGRRQFTSDLLVNLARRNQSMLYRQLDIINQLEESESDPDALAELFRLDHLATRVRRNAESLLVLSGEQPPRVWSGPVALRDVVRAAIAETEDLERVVFVVDERPSVAGHTVTDLTHLLAELTENAVRFSPPDTVVTIRARPDPHDVGGQVLTVEDWGVGLPAEDLEAANSLLASPPEVDLSVSQRLGFHVVARLAARHRIKVSLSATPGSGITAVLGLPSGLFDAGSVDLVRPAAPPSHAAGDRLVRGGSAPWTAPAPTGAPAATLPLAPEPGPSRRPDPTPAVASRRPPADPPPPASVLAPRDATPFAGVGGTRNTWSGWWDPMADGGNGGPAFGDPPPGRPAPPPADSALGAYSAPPDVPYPRSRPGDRGAPGPVERGSARAVDPESARQGDQGSPDDPPAPANGLRRRTPQAHLAPELRGPGDGPGRAPSLPPAHAAEAAVALSRYQASRQAARSAADAAPNGREPQR